MDILFTCEPSTYTIWAEDIDCFKFGGEIVVEGIAVLVIVRLVKIVHSKKLYLIIFTGKIVSEGKAPQKSKRWQIREKTSYFECFKMQDSKVHSVSRPKKMDQK